MTRTLRLAGAGLAATAIGWGGYAAVAWWRYGKDAAEGPPNPFLDGLLPHPEVLDYFRRKADDYDRWIRGMRRLDAHVKAIIAEEEGRP